MPGRPDFSTPGTRGSEQTVATTDRPDVELLEATPSQTVASGDNQAVEFFAPSGSMYRVLSMFVKVPAVDPNSSNGHTVLFKSHSGVPVVFVSDTGAERLLWRNSESRNKDVRPTNGAAGVEAVSTLRATEDQPIEINYVNTTNYDQTDPRDFRLIVEEQSF